MDPDGCSWIVWELFQAAAATVREVGLTLASEALAQLAVGTDRLRRRDKRVT